MSGGAEGCAADDFGAGGFGVDRLSAARAEDGETAADLEREELAAAELRPAAVAERAGFAEAAVVAP